MHGGDIYTMPSVADTTIENNRRIHITVGVTFLQLTLATDSQLDPDRPQLVATMELRESCGRVAGELQEEVLVRTCNSYNSTKPQLSPVHARHIIQILLYSR
jgi:hypothetical protein